MGMDEKTLQVASMRVSALVVTGDDDLTVFRRKRLGKLSTVDLERLKLVRDFVRAVAVNLNNLDEGEIWKRMADAARALGVAPENAVDQDPSESQAEEDGAPASESAPDVAAEPQATTTETAEGAGVAAPGPAPPVPPPSVPRPAVSTSPAASVSAPPPVPSRSVPPPPVRSPSLSSPNGAASPWTHPAPGGGSPPPPSSPGAVPAEGARPPAPSSAAVPRVRPRADDEERTGLHEFGTLDGSPGDGGEAVSDRAALPFRPSDASAPPASDRHVNLEAGLPFGAKASATSAGPSPAGPSPAGPHPTEASGDEPSAFSHISLEDYAELCLVTRAYPAYADQARKRFGLENASSQALVDRYFQKRFTDNPAEQQEFYAAYERVRQRFGTAG